MRKRFRLIILGVIILVYSFFNLSNDELKDNYYYAINGDVIKENKLDEGEYSWSYFSEAQDRVNDDIELVVKDIINGNNNVLSKKEISTIKGIYDRAIDMDKRNKDGIKELEPYLDLVWNIDNVDELVDVIIIIEKELGIGLLSEVEVIQDYKDNSRNIIYLYPVTYAFGASSDYIVDADYMAYKAYIRRACVQLWKVYGLDSKEAREVVGRVFSFYENVSNNSKLVEDLDEIDNYYNLVSGEEVNDIFNKVKGKYLSRRDIDIKDVYSIVDYNQYKYLNDSLSYDNLGVWKEVIVTKVLASYAVYGGEEYVEVVNNLNEAIIGSSENKSREEEAIDIVKGIFSNEIDKVYEDSYLNEKRVIEIEEMFLEIKDVFKDRLRNNSWLSDMAIEKAIDKLEEMKIIVGMEEDDNEGIAGSLEISNTSLMGNVIKIQQLAIKEELERLESNKDNSLVNQVEVNAYYQPLDNSIVIPVAFFELINEDMNYYEKLGTLGMILAHEVTHAFDSNGSKFDEMGNLNNWWSDDDREVFEELKDKVSNYYSRFEVIEGKYINGDRTVNENIADLGALECIVDIAMKREASDKEMREMFSSFAKIWASVESKEYMELLLLQDVHAPNKFRVNAVLSSIDEFYQVYDIYPWSDMWINNDKRVMVW